MNDAEWCCGPARRSSTSTTNCPATGPTRTGAWMERMREPRQNDRAGRRRRPGRRDRRAIHPRRDNRRAEPCNGSASGDELKLGERDTDLRTLFYRAAADALGGVPVTLDGVIGAHYEEPAQAVRGWWNGWS